ncbi:reverse transcriptase domain-containing protein [Tanacetum coccineum]
MYQVYLPEDSLPIDPSGLSANNIPDDISCRLLKREVGVITATPNTADISPITEPMPFGLCNALATFQRCMLAIFHDMIEEFVEVFMDDFSVYGNSFDNCLNNLDKMLQRCKDANLFLNWENVTSWLKKELFFDTKCLEQALKLTKPKSP